MVGQAVWVPFGEQTIQGIVIEITSLPTFIETRPISNIISSKPLLSKNQIVLAKWLSEYYLSPLFEAISLMLPPGFERKSIVCFKQNEKSSRDISILPPDLQHLITKIRIAGRLSLLQIVKTLGKTRARRSIEQLLYGGFIQRYYEIAPQKIKLLQKTFVKLSVNSIVAKKEIANLCFKAPRQAEALNYLVNHESPLPLSGITLATGISARSLKSLAARGLITLYPVEIRRKPPELTAPANLPSLELNPDQEKALGKIRSSIRNSTCPSIFLLHGVTGSGKTEVYLQALSEAVNMGKRGIVLVPEIALTPQIIERFESRFPGRVAVIHSQLPLGEQYDEWHRIANGNVDVVIGPRSATFVPISNLSLIVIDEEHEWTYKQQERSPFFDARRVALKRAEIEGSTVILGSATPDVSDYYKAQKGLYQLLELPHRLMPHVGAPLPKVEIVDMRIELKNGNRSVFSNKLRQAINAVLGKKEQVILFNNRRGGATFIQCRDCGYALQCHRCSVPLSYHPAESSLHCHQCNAHRKIPLICPRCQSQRIKFLGLGTQKLEEEARIAFPKARILRWDSDTTRHREAHREILNRFYYHQADMLIGTQMIAKGLNLPLVTLVGIVNPDTILNLPDFRASERTFQLLSQVSGRAGRGKIAGQVIIQTYNPDHYAIETAVQHDYTNFYKQEIIYRQKLSYPPFTQLARLTFSHTNNRFAREEAVKTKRIINQTLAEHGLIEVRTLGPTPAFIHRLRGRYRWQIIIRGRRLSKILEKIEFPRGWAIDIDPIGL
jgi:primosomal protein N' (replication factor Y)